ARRQGDVLLYYPIYDLWAEYLPVAEPLKVNSQSPQAQRLVGSFMRLGQLLQRSQIPFTLIDHEYLASAEVDESGRVEIGGQAYRAILLPAGTELPQEAADVVANFTQHGGTVLTDGPAGETLDRTALLGSLQAAIRLDPPLEQITMGRFTREGRAILLTVNVGKTPYEGRLATGMPGSWMVLNPADSSQTLVESDSDGQLPLALAARETAILVHVR
ncbi:MAG: hypothetical protein ACYTG0_14600, partial [Planctomycetota bacterium]